MIIKWWEPHFPYHVIFSDGESSSPWTSQAIKRAEWLEASYPALVGDKSISSQGETVQPYYDFDWGFCRTSIDQFLVFYFKDGNVAMHFKLVWA